MRRATKILALAFAFVFILAFSACGDSFESAIIRAAREMENVESVHADMDLNMEFGVEALGESTSMPINMLMSMDTAGNRTSGEMNVTMMGFPVSMTYIVEQNGESFDLYMSMDGGATWESQLGVTAGELASSGYSFDSDAGDMVNFYLEFAANFGEAVDETLDGVDCSRYDGSFPGAHLAEAMDMSGGGSFAELPEGAVLPDAPISVWLAKDDGLPRRISIDMTDAMGQYMTGVFTDSGVPEDMLSVEAVTVTVDLSEYNSAQPLQVPTV